MKSTYETKGGKYRQDSDYLLPNLEVRDVFCGASCGISVFILCYAADALISI